MPNITCAELATFTCGEMGRYRCDGLFLLKAVTDRTVSDYKNRTPKGIYKYSDWNRVEESTGYLAQLLTDAGYPVVITTKTDWAAADWPWDTDMSRYFGNVKKCVDQFMKLPGSPDLPSNMDYLTHTGANIIEQTLLDIGAMIGYMEKAYRDAGTFEAGE